MKYFIKAYITLSLIASIMVSCGKDDIITRRKPFLIVETCVGTVTGYRDNGKAYGKDSHNNYIGYGNVNAKLEDKVLTFMIWNPCNNYEDDIMARFDIIIGNEVHK